MILFGNAWEVIADRANFDHFHPSATAFQLLVAAFNDHNFASLLLNHADSMHEYADSKALRFRPEYTEGVDFAALELVGDFDSYLNALLRQQDADLFADTLLVLKEQNKDHWLCHELVLSPLIEVVFTLAHVENMLIKQDGSSDKSLAQLNGESYTELAMDMVRAITMASVFQNERFVPDAVAMVRDLSDNTGYLSEHELRGVMTAERSSMMLEFFNMLNRVAVDYSVGSLNGLFKESRAIRLEYSDNQVYNLANKHLNKNYEVGTVEIPSPLFKRLPFSSESNGGLHVLVDVDTLSGGNKAYFPNYVSYTLSDGGCDCEHDCCGCVTEDVSALMLSDKWALVSRSAQANF